MPSWRPFALRWKGKPYSEWFAGEATQGDLTFSFHCLVCDLAFALGMSEDEFYDKYDINERAQLVATYQSKLDRQSVMAIAPLE